MTIILGNIFNRIQRTLTPFFSHFAYKDPYKLQKKQLVELERQHREIQLQRNFELQKLQVQLAIREEREKWNRLQEKHLEMVVEDFEDFIDQKRECPNPNCDAVIRHHARFCHRCGKAI